MYVFCGHNEVVVITVICLLFAGKVLIIGGGIANFTNVAATFKVGRVGRVESSDVYMKEYMVSVQVQSWQWEYKI